MYLTFQYLYLLPHEGQYWVLNRVDYWPSNKAMRKTGAQDGEAYDYEAENIIQKLGQGFKEKRNNESRA